MYDHETATDTFRDQAVRIIKDAFRYSDTLGAANIPTMLAIISAANGDLQKLYEIHVVETMKAIIGRNWCEQGARYLSTAWGALLTDDDGAQLTPGPWYLNDAWHWRGKVLRPSDFHYARTCTNDHCDCGHECDDTCSTPQSRLERAHRDHCSCGCECVPGCPGFVPATDDTDDTEE